MAPRPAVEVIILRSAECVTRGRACKLRSTAACLALLALAACASSGDRRTPSTGFLDFEGAPKSTVMITVHFKESASKADMARVVEELSNHLHKGGFADIPNESAAFHEEHRLVMGWASAEAAKRAESKVRPFLDGVQIVERIDVSRP